MSYLWTRKRIEKMLKKVVFFKGQKGNYFTCDGNKIYYPERKLQKELDEKKITEPLVFVKHIKVVTKSGNYFISGKIVQTKPLDKLSIMNYIAGKNYDKLIKIFTEKTECLYAVETSVGEENIIKILADTGNGIEEFVSVCDDGYNKTGFLRGLLKNWAQGTKKLDILIYSDIVKTRELAKDAIEIDKDETLFLGAYLRLKGLLDKKPSLDFEIINNKYVKNKNVVCFRTKDMWYFDSLNFTPYLDEISVRTPISVDAIDAYIEENMLTYKNVEDEVVDKKVYITEENYYNIPLVNINVVDYYALQSADLKDIIKECKETLEDIRKEVGRNATRTNAIVISKLTRRKVLGLDEE